MNKLIALISGLFIFNLLTGQIHDKVKIFDKETPIIGFNVSDYMRFDPTTKNVLIADSLAQTYVLQNSKEQTSDNKPISYTDYFRQVYGLIDKNGDKILLINCFIKLDGHDYWKKNTVSVKGGGSNYFNIKVNLISKSCFDFWINAPM